MKTDPTIKEWMFAREMLRRLGFTPDELFFEVFPSGQSLDAVTGEITNLGGPIIALSVRREGREFKWTIGVTKLPVAEIQPSYELACDQWNTDGAGWSVEEFRASRPMARAVELLVALEAKGFKIRKVN